MGMWDWNTEESKRKWLINSFCLFFFIYLFLNVTILCVIKCVSMCFHQSLVKCIWSSHTPPTPLPDSLLFTPCSCPRCCIAYAEGFRCVFDVCVRSMCSACVCACKSRCFCKRRKEIRKKQNNNGGDANVLWKLGEQVWPHAQRSRYKWALLSEP